MSLLRHGCQRHSFLNSQTDSQMYTFPDQMNWQFVQILMDSKLQSKLRVLDTDDVKQKTSLFSVQGKSGLYVFMVFWFFVLYVIKCPHSHHSHPVHLFNTWISRECIKCRMDGSQRKPYICLSFDFLILNNYSLKSRWIVAKYLPSGESGEVNIPKATIHQDWKE